MRKSNTPERRTGGAIAPELAELAARLIKARKHAAALGIFTDDRELLACACGLMENINFGGTLFTCLAAHLEKDTGLRFKRLNQHAYRCPKCKMSLTEPTSLATLR
jgi:hypothetical protein